MASTVQSVCHHLSSFAVTARSISKVYWKPEQPPPCTDILRKRLLSLDLSCNCLILYKVNRAASLVSIGMDYIRVAQTFEQLFVIMRTSSRLTLFDAVHCPRTTVSNFRPNNCCAWAALLTISSFEIDVAFRMIMLTGFRNIYSFN